MPLNDRRESRPSRRLLSLAIVVGAMGACGGSSLPMSGGGRGGSSGSGGSVLTGVAGTGGGGGSSGSGGSVLTGVAGIGGGGQSGAGASTAGTGGSGRTICVAPPQISGQLNPKWSASLNVSRLTAHPDARGNIVLAGAFRERLELGPNTIATVSGDNAFLLALGAETGMPLWSRTLGNRSIADFAIDASGNFVVVGGASVAKLNPMGEPIWSAPLGGMWYASAVTTDSAGNVAVSGTIQTDGQGSPPFVVVYDSSGRELWRKTPGGTSVNIGFDPQSRLVVAGVFTGTLDFGSMPLTSPTGAAYIAKLDISGAVLSASVVAAGSDPNPNLSLEPLVESWIASFAPAIAPAFKGIAPTANGGYFAVQTIDEFVDLGAGVVPPRGFAVLRHDDRGSRTASAAFNATSAGSWLMADAAGNAFVWGFFEGAIRLGTDMPWVEPPGRKAFVMKLAAEPFPGSPPSPCPAPPDGPLLAGLQLDSWDIPRAIAVMPGAVAVATNKQLVTLPLDGGPAKILASGLLFEADMKVRDGTIYWADLWSSAQPNATGSIRSIPAAGGTVTVLADGQDRLRAMAVDDRNVYWISGGATSIGGGQPVDGTVWSLPRTGGTPTMLLTGLDVVGLKDVRPIAAAGGTAIVMNFGFTEDGARYQIIRLANGSADVLVSTVAIIHAVAMDDTNVYWSESDNGLFNWETQAQIKTMPLAGGAIRVLASGQTDPRLLEVDAGTVYWANHGLAGTPGLGGVWRVATSGGAPVPIATQLSWVDRLSVGAAGVAYVEEAQWKTQTTERRSWALMLSAR